MKTMQIKRQMLQFIVSFFVMSILSYMFLANDLMATPTVAFPIEGLSGDSDCPKDSGTTADGNRNWYTVVWGGKYNGNWNTRCKGTGGHSGMDIAVGSGTQVRSIAAGTVYKSYDDPGWGGLVVIKHEKEIFGTETPIWSIYAHLKQRDVGSGDTVSVNDVVGLSGGASSDPNHGTSTGAHLHF